MLVVVEEREPRRHGREPEVGGIAPVLQRIDRRTQRHCVEHAVVELLGLDRDFGVQIVQVEAHGEGEEREADHALSFERDAPHARDRRHVPHAQRAHRLATHQFASTPRRRHFGQRGAPA